MVKIVSLLSLIAAPMVEVTDVKKLTPSKRGPDDLPYRVTFDTPVDGEAGAASVDISEARAIALGLVEVPDIVTEIDPETPPAAADA
jgi:hypothetical protein